MRLPFAASDLTIGAILAGLLGIAECFFGYRFFRLVLAIVGFFVGAAIAIGLINTDQTVVILLVGLIGGLIGATIFYFLYFIGPFLAGIFLGATIGAILAGDLGLSSTGAGILVIIGAVIGGLLGFVLSKYIIMLSTAVTGAAQIVYAVLLLLPSTHVIQAADQVQVNLTSTQSVVVTLIILLLAAVGFAVQVGMNRREVHVVPPQSPAQPLS